LGVPLWLDTTEPAQKPAMETADDPAPARAFPSLQRLMVSQDTGGAIRGPVRGDFFWGFGEDAEEKAGRMKQSGHYYLLLPKTVRPNLAGVKDPQGGKS